MSLRSAVPQPHYHSRVAGAPVGSHTLQPGTRAHTFLPLRGHHSRGPPLCPTGPEGTTVARSPERANKAVVSPHLTWGRTLSAVSATPAFLLSPQQHGPS